jgi:hypothetical protein
MYTVLTGGGGTEGLSGELAERRRALPRRERVGLIGIVSIV